MQKVHAVGFEGVANLTPLEASHRLTAVRAAEAVTAQPRFWDAMAGDLFEVLKQKSQSCSSAQTACSIPFEPLRL